MGTEELGSVYEGLLELHPKIEREPWGFTYVGLNGDATRGHERKLSGSYYTPDSLVQELIKSALEPVMLWELRERRFLHWPLAFPEVFSGGGFDVVAGNPPWEVLQFSEEEFFAARDQRIANAPTQAARASLRSWQPQLIPPTALCTAATRQQCAPRTPKRTSFAAPGDGGSPQLASSTPNPDFSHWIAEWPPGWLTGSGGGEESGGELKSGPWG
jgi:hypothetical protein